MNYITAVHYSTSRSFSSREVCSLLSLQFYGQNTNDQFPVDLIAQLVKHCIDITVANIRRLLRRCFFISNTRFAYPCQWRKCKFLVSESKYGWLGQTRQHGEASCHRSHHCWLFIDLFRYRRTCGRVSLLLDRLCVLWSLDRRMGEYIIICRYVISEHEIMNALRYC